MSLTDGSRSEQPESSAGNREAFGRTGRARIRPRLAHLIRVSALHSARAVSFGVVQAAPCGLATSGAAEHPLAWPAPS